MTGVVEATLPANEGPGVGADEQAAVDQNTKATSFLMSAMPNTQVINLMAAGLADPTWPNVAKAHLMIAYLKDTFENTSTLSKVGAKWDLKNCTMKWDENPKNLFQKLVTVQFKYQGNAQVRISNDELVTQAVQALPSMYNLAVASLFKTEWCAGVAVTLAVLKKVVSDYYSIAMKGKTGTKAKDIEGGLAAVDTQAQVNEKDNLKWLIQETINMTIHEFSIKHQPTNTHHGQGGCGHGLATVSTGNMGTSNMGLSNPGHAVMGQPSLGISLEMMMAIDKFTPKSSLA